jgi:hypothetical protein
MLHNGLLNNRSACVAPAAGILAFNCCMLLIGALKSNLFSPRFAFIYFCFMARILPYA